MLNNDDKIVWARCRSSKKWFWCVWILWTDNLIAHGQADTVEECQRLAKQYEPEYEERAGFAEYRRRQLAAIRRKEAATSKQQATSNATIEEFVVVPFYDSEFGNHYRHRIVKRTKAKVFVEEDGESCGSDGQPTWIRRRDEGWREWSIPTIALDRQTLERDGSVWHRGSRERYWISMAQWRQEHSNDRDRIPDGLIEILRLPEKSNKDEARKKFKKLLAAAHPDHGGTSEDFQKWNALRQEYPSVLA